MFRNSFCCPSDHFLRHAKWTAFTQFCPGVGMVIRNQNTTGHSAHPRCYLKYGGHSSERMFLDSTAQKEDTDISSLLETKSPKHPHQNFRFFSPWFLSWGLEAPNWDQNLSAGGKIVANTVASWFQCVENMEPVGFSYKLLKNLWFFCIQLGWFCIDMYWVHQSSKLCITAKVFRTYTTYIGLYLHMTYYKYLLSHL